MEEEKNILTNDGLKKFKNELKELINVQRPKIIQEIKDARLQGDLSENAEFDAAREKQGQIEDRIKEIEKIIAESKIVKKSSNNTSSSSHQKITIGSTVEVQNLKTNKKEIYTIVGTLEVDPFDSKISNKSILAQALLGHVKNDVVKVNAQSKYEVKILKIKKDH